MPIVIDIMAIWVKFTNSIFVYSRLLKYSVCNRLLKYPAWSSDLKYEKYLFKEVYHECHKKLPPNVRNIRIFKSGMTEKHGCC